MKPLLIILISLWFTLPNFAQKNSFIATYTQNGKERNDTTIIKDTILAHQINQMMTNPNYKLLPPKNDTIYDKHGKPILVKYSDTIFGASFQVMEYDSLGRLIKLIGYNDKGSIKPYWEDIAIETYKYDFRGNKIETRYFGKDKKPLRIEIKGPAVIRYMYDDKNREIEERYLDENGKFLPDFAREIIHYDENGRKSEVLDFDGNGNEIKQ